MTDIGAKAPKVFLPCMVEPETKAWVERAAANRRSSRAAIVREALAAYARLHPTLGDDYGDGAESEPDPELAGALVFGVGGA